MNAFFDDILDTLRKNGRVEELRQIARINNFAFKNRERFSVQDYLLKPFSIFKGKNDKRFKGVLKKADKEFGSIMRVYDYVYFGDMKTYQTTVYEVFNKELNLPKFEIYPKGFLKKVTGFFMDKEKPYAHDTEFYSKFDILTKDKDEFEMELSRYVLDYVFDRKIVSMEGEGDYLLVYITNQKTPAKDIMVEYELILDLVELVLANPSNNFV